MFVFQTGFLNIAALAILKLSLYTRLALNSQRSVCLCFPSAGIKGVCHHRRVETSFNPGSKRESKLTYYSLCEGSRKWPSQENHCHLGVPALLEPQSNLETFSANSMTYGGVLKLSCSSDQEHESGLASKLLTLRQKPGTESLKLRLTERADDLRID